MRLLLAAIVFLAVVACGGDGSSEPDTTTTDCDMPVGREEDCPTDREDNVDRYAEYTRCIREDEVPNEECPTPEELLDGEP